MFDYPCFIYYIQLFESTLVWPVDVEGFLKSFSAQTYHVALDEVLRHRLLFEQRETLWFVHVIHNAHFPPYLV